MLPCKGVALSEGDYEAIEKTYLLTSLMFFHTRGENRRHGLVAQDGLLVPQSASVSLLSPSVRVPFGLTRVSSAVPILHGLLSLGLGESLLIKAIGGSTDQSSTLSLMELKTRPVEPPMALMSISRTQAQYPVTHRGTDADTRFKPKEHDDGEREAETPRLMHK